ncbi:hypothetical protein BaRGS_00039706 [Batillaria attramentaria]|uniref:Tyrosine-protein kinase ephrin type A/B receptor-like domain-containing protein n=1 Tax=Batillaria attramentaria TaxID=370345 RepID=A0ABD0J332_9CAEN
MVRPKFLVTTRFAEVTPVLNVTLNQSITINEGVCQGNTEREVMSLVKKKMAQLPCQQHGICTVEVEGQCDLNGRLTLSTKVDVRLDKHFSPTDDDKSKASKYQAAVMVTKESFENMTNGTERMYSGTANGRSFTPNLESRRYNGYLHCPPGQVPVDGVCGECPKGYREEHDQCVECPFEQYQDQRASTECKPCPEGLSSKFLGATSVRQCNRAYFEFPSLNNNVLVGRENTVANLQFRLVNDDCFRMTDFEIFVSKLEKDYTFTRYCRILITNGSCLLSGVDSVCRRCHAVPGNQEAERDREGMMPDEYEMHGMLYERGIQGEHRAQDEREMHGMLYERGIQGEHSAQDERDMYTPLRRLSRVAQRGRSAVISAVSGIYDIIR